jgi:hypothetical protein
VDVTRHNTHLAFTRLDNARAVRSDQTSFIRDVESMLNSDHVLQFSVKKVIGMTTGHNSISFIGACTCHKLFKSNFLSVRAVWCNDAARASLHRN